MKVVGNQKVIQRWIVKKVKKLFSNPILAPKRPKWGVFAIFAYKKTTKLTYNDYRPATFRSNKNYMKVFFL